MLDSLNEFHLKYIPTFELEKLKTEIGLELSSRKKAKRIENQRLIAEAPSLYVDMTRPEVENHNKSRVLAIPGNYARKAYNCTCFLDSLIKQDWSHLYSGGDDAKKYYVYAHIDPNKPIFQASDECGGNWGGQPFYIGKGTGGRAFELDRNQGHGKIIKIVKADGYTDTDIAKIIISNLTEAKALEIEAKLIYFFGTIYDKTLKKKGMLYNLVIPKLPAFESEMIDYRKVELSVEDYSSFETNTALWDKKHPLATDIQRQAAIKTIARKFGVKLTTAKEVINV